MNCDLLGVEYFGNNQELRVRPYLYMAADRKDKTRKKIPGCTKISKFLCEHIIPKCILVMNGPIKSDLSGHQLWRYSFRVN